MRTPLPYVAGIAAAAGTATIILFVLFTAAQGISVFDMEEFFALLAVNAVLAVIVGVPTILLLRKYNSFRWAPLSVSWGVSSSLLIGGALALLPEEEFFGDATLFEILVISAVAAITGWVCGLACWFTIVERTRER